MANSQDTKQPAQEPVVWISVKDRLPTEVGRYLVYVEEIYDLGNAHYIWNAGFNPNDGIFQEETMKGATVTHWMNLPNTPNGISHYINSIHPATQPAQEPVAYADYERGTCYLIGTPIPVNEIANPLYTHPAPSWQGLDEYRHLKWCVEQYRDCVGFELKSSKFQSVCEALEEVDAIEQALKEKNER